MIIIKIEAYEADNLLEKLGMRGIALPLSHENGNKEIDIEVRTRADRSIDYKMRFEDQNIVDGTIYRGDEQDREAYRAFSNYVTGGFTPP